MMNDIFGMGRVWSISAGIGLLLLAKWTANLIMSARFFLRTANIERYKRPVAKSDREKPHEPWALITGSSAGLGRALAYQLADKGFNIIVHGSSKQKLAAVREDLSQKYPSRSFRMLVLDARMCDPTNISELKTKLDEVVDSLDDIQLRILINNVGSPQARPEKRAPFDAIDTFTYEELLHNTSVNAIFPLLLTRAVYPLLARSQPALIINLGSLAAHGFPLFPSYGPSKVFQMASSDELRLESAIGGLDIDVLAIDVMGFTGSDTIKEKPSLLIPDATTYARAVLRSVGSGYPRVAPYLPHAIFFWVLDSLPSLVRDRMMAGMMKSMREEATRKLAGLHDRKSD